MSELLLDRPADGVARLTLNRPAKRNALSISLRDEISDALDVLAGDDTVRCVVVAAAGDVFCAGFDLREFEVGDAPFQERLWASADRYHRAVLHFPLPTVAAVGGAALAGGMDLAVMCDLRIAASTARFAHPEYAFGPVIYRPLRDLVGGSVARDLCLTGRSIEADEALRVHLVNAVVAPEELERESIEVAARVAAAPREQLAATKAKALRCAGLDPAAPTLDL